jgi:hypothetical protein
MKWILWFISWFFTKKTNSSGLRYEVALNIMTGDICWINGPFLLGEWNDLEIFRSSLMTWLEVLERVDVDMVMRERRH